MMIIKIAWKNIWRNPTRSLVVILSVFLGLWSGIFMIAFSNGMNDQRTADQLNNSIGHLKVSHPKFSEEKLTEYYIDKPDQILQSLEVNPAIKAITPRINVTGMASSSSGSFGVDIYGIIPEREKQVFELYKNVIEGAYLEGIKRNPILIGAKLAKRLNLKVRSKMVLTFQNLEGDITSGAFRVAGIYQSNNSAFEETHVFAPHSDLQRILDVPETVFHQIICKTQDYYQAPKIAETLENKVGSNQILAWNKIAPELAYLDEIMIYFFMIFMGVILLALSMGILNTMLMAVLERTRELGMLMAIGMSRARIFIMIMIETIFLTCTALPIGLAFSWLSIYLTQYYGIDLGAVAEGFSSIGYSSLVRPSLDIHEYLVISGMVFTAALLSALYPAWKALQLKPAQAIRKI
ncbi:MAG: FtsX-like permease family protein [Bacteroidota bacterium]